MLTITEYNEHLAQQMGERGRGGLQERVRQLIERLRLETGREIERYHTFNSRKSEPGFPDEVIVLPRRLIVAELKSERGRVTPDQRRWLDAFGSLCFGEVYLWRPRHLLSGEIARILTADSVPAWEPASAWGAG